MECWSGMLDVKKMILPTMILPERLLEVEPRLWNGVERQRIKIEGSFLVVFGVFCGD